MTAPQPEIRLGDCDREQIPLALATDGVLRYVWQSAFGPMLIEARDGQAFVNGQRVTPAAETEGRGTAPGRGEAADRSLTLVGRG